MFQHDDVSKSTPNLTADALSLEMRVPAATSHAVALGVAVQTAVVGQARVSKVTK